jgi:hypothetical protein
MTAPGCQHGRSLGRRCKQCEQFVTEQIRAFHLDVLIGKYDLQGYELDAKGRRKQRAREQVEHAETS